MASTTLTVTVYGGVTPQDINVTFFKNGTEIPTNGFASTQSFEKTYDNLDNGLYDIYISGLNPLSPGSSTKFELSTNEVTIHPPDDTPTIKTGKMYLVQFSFSV